MKINNTKINDDISLVNFGNPFSFRNRSGRLDYLVYGEILPLSILLGGFLLIGKYNIDLFLELWIILVYLLIHFAAVVRRARDTNNKIIWIVIPSLIPYVNILTMIYFLLVPSRFKN